jgi:soluble lytic murein transglycosylase-like protein
MQSVAVRLVGLTLLVSLEAVAGEYAILVSGFRLHAERHENHESVVRLYSNEGVTELPAAQVVGFEIEDYVPQPAPSSPAVVGDIPSPKEMVARAAKRNGLPPEFVNIVAEVESGHRTDAISPKGALGIMQLMPKTAEALHADPTDPEQNVEAGVRYLRDLLVKYQDDPFQLRKALAAYNAGPGAVDRYRGVPPYPETQQYVKKVLRRYTRLTKGKK